MQSADLVLIDGFIPRVNEQRIVPRALVAHVYDGRHVDEARVQ